MIYDGNVGKHFNSLTKIQMLGVTILLSLTVFMNMVSEIIPNTSDAVSIIGIIQRISTFLEYEYFSNSFYCFSCSVLSKIETYFYITSFLYHVI